MKTPKISRIFLFVAILVIASLACNAGGPFGFWINTGSVPATVQVCTVCQASPTQISAPAPLSPTTIPVPTVTGWIGDQFGPEQAFPAIINGPATAEIKGDAGFCALVKVNLGETLNWQNGGAWWQAFSQEALEARFPHHEAEYSAKWPKCKIFLHAYDVK